jgi:phosphoribosylformylglycinamidine synthase
VDNLNFGNPSKPEQYWILKQSVLGLADAAKKLNIPVVGGNVSLYNESAEFETAIPPTPSIGLLGIVDLKKPVPSSFFHEADESILLIGTTTDEMGGSEYNRVCGIENAGAVPTVPSNYDKIVKTVADVCASGNVTSAHDVSKGGLAVALSNMVTNIGADIDLSDTPLPRTDDFFFSESPARVIVTTKNPEKIVALVKDIPCKIIGKTTKTADLKIKTAKETLLWTKAEMDEAAATIENAMKKGYTV